LLALREYGSPIDPVLVLRPLQPRVVIRIRTLQPPSRPEADRGYPCDGPMNLAAVATYHYLNIYCGFTERLLFRVDREHRPVNPFEIRDVGELDQDPTAALGDINLNSSAQPIGEKLLKLQDARGAN
jgi:hypothetical protein